MSATGPHIATLALLVRDYDEAIAFFTTAMRFALVEDSPRDLGKRWVVVRPPGGGVSILLAKAATPEQLARVGDQVGGRVALFLETDDFARDHAHMTAHGVRFAESPRRELYGTVAVFEDLYGNRWDLIERATTGPPPPSATSPAAAAIRARVVPTLANYRRFLIYESFRMIWWLYALAALTLICFAFSPILPFVYASADPAARYAANLRMLFLPFVVFVALPLAKVFNAGRAWRRADELRATTTFTFSEAGFEMVSTHSRATVAWAMIKRVRRQPGLVALGLGQRLYYLIPTDAFESPAAREAFEGVLRRHVPAAGRR